MPDASGLITDAELLVMHNYSVLARAFTLACHCPVCRPYTEGDRRLPELALPEGAGVCDPGSSIIRRAGAKEKEKPKVKEGATKEAVEEAPAGPAAPRDHGATIRRWAERIERERGGGR